MAEAQTWKISMIEKGPGKAKIKMASGEEEWLKVSERAESFKNKIPDGALVKLSFQGDAISAIFEVDENGNVKQQNPSTKQTRTGGYKRTDPEQERIKNQYILCESLATRAVEVAEISMRYNLEPEERERLWQDVLSMTIQGAERITAHILKESK
ncbi:MAG: hypothetical protein LBV40_07595 [Methanomicrobiales archaeon]|jgi:hypothetical protein|nr:hypothetical protein [Methanomicrobiales archaeon]